MELSLEGPLTLCAQIFETAFVSSNKSSTEDLDEVKLGPKVGLIKGLDPNMVQFSLVYLSSVWCSEG